MADNFEALARKERMERMRWFILRALDICRPEGAYLSFVLDAVRGIYRDATELEVKREIDYLADRDLVKLTIDATEQWFVELDRYGVGVVTYAVPVEPGIARPKFGG
ncbi:MAG: hypothetical protein QM702_04435 [Rubrivivax sp.]